LILRDLADDISKEFFPKSFPKYFEKLRRRIVVGKVYGVGQEERLGFVDSILIWRAQDDNPRIFLNEFAASLMPVETPDVQRPSQDSKP
jgi:hypothetical protein